MSKSVNSPLGTVLVLDAPEEIDRKVRKAVTDTEAEVRYDPAAKPGVSNLLELLAAVDGGDPAELAGRYASYGSSRRTCPRRWSSCCARCASATPSSQADRGYVRVGAGRRGGQGPGGGGPDARPGHARRRAARSPGRLQRLTARPRHVGAAAASAADRRPLSTLTGRTTGCSSNR